MRYMLLVYLEADGRGKRRVTLRHPLLASVRGVVGTAKGHGIAVFLVKKKEPGMSAEQRLIRRPNRGLPLWLPKRKADAPRSVVTTSMR